MIALRPGWRAATPRRARSACSLSAAPPQRRRAARPASAVVRRPGDGVPVSELQQLDRPLDVGQPAAAEFECGWIGSAPRGSRSLSMRPFSRRISTRSLGGDAVGRVAHRVDQPRRSAAPRSASPATESCPQQRLRLPRRGPARVVTARRTAANARGDRCAPPGAESRRRRAAGRSRTGRRAACAAAGDVVGDREHRLASCHRGSRGSKRTSRPRPSRSRPRRRPAGP